MAASAEWRAVNGAKKSFGLFERSVYLAKCAALAALYNGAPWIATEGKSCLPVK